MTKNEAGMLKHIDDLTDTNDILRANYNDLANAAAALLLKIEGMTTAEFTIGGESKERNALRQVLTNLGWLEPDGN